MKEYKNFDTGEIWTEEEIKKEYEAFRCEMEDDFGCFEDYLDHLLDMGRNRTGGLIEI